MSVIVSLCLLAALIIVPALLIASATFFTVATSVSARLFASSCVSVPPSTFAFGVIVTLPRSLSVSSVLASSMLPVFTLTPASETLIVLSAAFTSYFTLTVSGVEIPVSGFVAPFVISTFAVVP